MITTPLLSILIPTRNRSSSLNFSLKSARQFLMLGKVEIIVISNGDSLKGDLQDVDPSTLQGVKIVRSVQRLGMSENWNFGLKYASGTWFTVLGDDDLIASSVLSDFMKTLERYANSDFNGIKTKVSGFAWKDVNGQLIPGEYKVISSENSVAEVPIDRNLRVLEVLPHHYPTGSAGSFLRTGWVLDFGLHLMFRSISPDWYTGYVFYLSNDKYIQFNGQVVTCGMHPHNSISLLKNQGNEFLEELSLSKSSGNLDLMSKFHQGFPTTWLSRVDALLQACESLKIADIPSWKHLVRMSYETTPRYVIKVFQVQSRAFPEYRLQHFVWLIQFLKRSLVKKLLTSF